MNVKTLVLAAALALGAGAVGIGYAAIPAANGTISACKDNKGALKVIDAEAGQSCASKQQLLTWNQQGPAGPQGTTGISGLQIVSADKSAPFAASSATAEAFCPPGKQVIAGGGSLNAAGAPVAATASYPVNGVQDSWRFQAIEMVPNSNVGWNVHAHAICAYVD